MFTDIRKVHSKGQKKYQRARRVVQSKAEERLAAQEIALAKRQRDFHLEQFSDAMIALHRSARSRQQRELIGRLYFEGTNKRLTDVLEQRIIVALGGQISFGAERRTEDNQS